MMTRFEFDDALRVVRPLRNYSTVAGLKRGELLVRRGSIGYVREWGTFLQDQLIYQVHFLEVDRIVGCRAQELIAADAPWHRGEFQYGDWVISLHALAVNGQPVVRGQQGQIQETDQGERGECYNVVFGESRFQVPSCALELCEETS